MGAVVTLGGNIILEGFESLDHAENLVIKKLVGSYIRSISDNYSECERAHFILSKKDEDWVVEVKVKADSSEIKAVDQGTNVFITLDGAIKKILKKIGIQNV